MELRRGLGLLTQQFRALLKKNVLLSWRHKRSTFLQLFSFLIFIFLIFLIQKAIQGRYSSTTIYHNVFDPKPFLSPPIPPCEDKFYIKFPCFDSTRIRSIVTRILANNPGRPIPSNKVLKWQSLCLCCLICQFTED
ncbi:hypothetical protein HYC85_029840 [Camellia sinensis]|uniref:Uncharacterized protein n=1 Tax=Camellia sinensis TaxID=4442 RepID=A0A7J7FZ86_CAMSI|nr:hypothetical protein HYC85_029840 [Camellia sinensis]